MPQSSDPGFIESSLLGIMTLLATLSAATEVRFRIEERKAGRDASTQEDEAFATSFLINAEDELRSALVMLRAGFILQQQDEQDSIAASVRTFSDLSRLQSMCSHLQRMHQRMLSLYPLVPEKLVEEARELINQCTSLLDLEEDQYRTGAPLFVQRALLFCDDLRASL